MMTRYVVILTMLWVTTKVSADESNFEPLGFLVGSWEGHEEGVPGTGHGERSYELIMDKTYLFAKNTSTFPPQEKNPDGEVHRDWQFFSYDRSAKKLALRQFHSESFIIEYDLDLEASSPKELVFVSKTIENYIGRAHYTLRLRDDDHFEELFEVSEGDGPLEVMVHNQWSRVS